MPRRGASLLSLKSAFFPMSVSRTVHTRPTSVSLHRSENLQTFGFLPDLSARPVHPRARLHPLQRVLRPVIARKRPQCELSLVPRSNGSESQMARTEVQACASVLSKTQQQHTKAARQYTVAPSDTLAALDHTLSACAADATSSSIVAFREALLDFGSSQSGSAYCLRRKYTSVSIFQFAS